MLVLTYMYWTHRNS